MSRAPLRVDLADGGGWEAACANGREQIQGFLAGITSNGDSPWYRIRT